MRSLFLVNERAHKVAKRGSALRAVADETGTPLVLLDEAFEPRASDDRVYIEGGDGTVSWVVDRYLQTGRALPQFAIVPGGTTNQVAGILGLRRKTGKGLAASLAEACTPVACPLIQLSHEGGRESGFVFSTGAIPQVTERLESYRGLADLSGVALVGRAVIDATRPGSQLLEATPARIEADLPGEHVVFDGDHTGVIATTLPSLYLGLDPFWGEQPGRLRVTYADGEARAILPTILGQWVGRKNLRTLRERGFQSFNTERMQVVTDGPVVLDGETLEARDLVLTVSPDVTFVR